LPRPYWLFKQPEQLHVPQIFVDIRLAELGNHGTGRDCPHHGLKVHAADRFRIGGVGMLQMPKDGQRRLLAILFGQVAQFLLKAPYPFRMVINPLHRVASALHPVHHGVERDAVITVHIDKIVAVETVIGLLANLAHGGCNKVDRQSVVMRPLGFAIGAERVEGFGRDSLRAA